MNISNKTISIAFIVVLIVTIGVSVIGMSLMSRQPMVLQGQVEATEIRISGKLPGRVDSFLVQEGDWVKAGDTLVVINSPTIEAKYRQVNALEQVAQEQNKKIDAGTRRQIIATALQLWNKTQSDLTLAQTTYQRILTLYKDSVVTSQRKDEVEAMYKAAQAAERAAYQQYQMAVDGAQSEDRAAARSLVDAVDVAEDNQDLRIHHGSYQSGELVIIGEHQFANGNGIVLVDNGNHSVFQHYGHAVFLVEIVAAGSEVLFHGEHLPHRDAVFTE